MMIRISTGQGLHALILLVMPAALFITVLQSEARNLTDVAASGFVLKPSTLILSAPVPTTGGPTPPVDFSIAGRTIAQSFSAAVAQTVTQEFPLASVSPAFVYHYNPAVDTFERLTSVPGPLFSERALTLGEGQLNFSIGYSFIDFSDLNGVPLNNLKNPGLIAEFFRNDPMTPVMLPTGEEGTPFPLSLSRLRTRIDLQAHVTIPTLRYGITSNWDMSLSVPIVNTFLRVKNETRRVVDADLFTVVDPETFEIKDVNSAGKRVDFENPPFVRSRRQPVEVLSRASGHATGVGDIILRSKYLFWRTGTGGAALALNLQVPSGEVKDFHGSGETHLSTFVYLSQIVGKRFEPHLNVGVDFNAGDVDRSSFLYALGGSFLVATRLGVVVDFLGRSEFGRLRVHLPAEAKIGGAVLNSRTPVACTTQQPCFAQGTFTFPVIPVRIKRNDIIDFSFGLRYTLGTAGSIFFGGVVPLNDDGFRPDFIPAAGIEYKF